MPETVDFSIGGDSKRAVAELNRVNKAQDAVIRDLTRMGRTSGQAARISSQAIGTIRRSYGALVGATGGALAVTGLFVKSVQSLLAQRQEIIGFDRDMTELLSLGDNISNIQAMRNTVLDLSGTWGVARKEIIDSMFAIQSGASSLSKEMRDELLREAVELTKVSGGDLNTATTLLIKTWNIYGDTLADVNQAQNKLFKAAELGFLTFSDLATLLPDVIAPAKALGLSLDEVLASLIVATQVGGNNEKTFTGVRNVYLRMNKAIEEGIPLSGSFLERMQTLSEIDPIDLARIFGVEAFTAIANLTSNLGGLKQALADVRDVQGDIVADKFDMRMKDASSAMAEFNRQTNQTIENLKLARDQSEEFQQKERAFQRRRVAISSRLDEISRNLFGTSGAFDFAVTPLSALAQARSGPRVSGQEVVGADIAINQALGAGDKQAAARLAQQFLSDIDASGGFGSSTVGSIEHRQFIRETLERVVAGGGGQPGNVTIGQIVNAPGDPRLSGPRFVTSTQE